MADEGAMVPLERALAMVDEALVACRPAGETVPVRQAHGRVLLAEQRSRLDLPPFDKSAMDGYAILPGDERAAYRLLETVAAGQVPSAKLAPGATIQVMTGAPVPAGTGMVVMREFAEECDGTVRIGRHGGADNICRKGEDIRVGDAVLPAGRMLGALDVANLIACGVTEVPVAPRVRLAVVSTGDEIVDDPSDLSPGKIMNANGPMLAHLAGEWGLEVVGERSVPDDLAATASALGASMASADLVVLSGGVSVGDFNYVLAAMAEAGLDVHFSRLAVKPGKPTVFATPQAGAGAGAVGAVFGLPGNPVSAWVMFHLFVLRAVALLSGGEPPGRGFRLPMAADYGRRKTDRAAFVPARLTPAGAVEPLTYHGSAHLLALTRADGFFRVPIGVAELPVGEDVAFYPMARGWR